MGVPHVGFLELREPSGVQRRVVDVLPKTFHTSQTSRGEVRGGAPPPPRLAENCSDGAPAAGNLKLQIDQTTAQNPHSPNSKFTLRAARRLLVRSPTPGVSDRIFYAGLLVFQRLFEHT